MVATFGLSSNEQHEERRFCHSNVIKMTVQNSRGYKCQFFAAQFNTENINNTDNKPISKQKSEVVQLLVPISRNLKTYQRRFYHI